VLPSSEKVKALNNKRKNGEVVKTYSKNESSNHEIVKVKQVYASSAVVPLSSKLWP
jgi:hypothetical protein